MTAVRRPANILVPTDGSPSGQNAIAYAISLARRHGASITICNALNRAGAIAECSSSSGYIDFTPLLQALDDEARSIVAEALAVATGAGVPSVGIVLDGSPVDAVLTYVAAHDPDAVVLGSEGKGAVDRFFLGSVANGILRRSICPVFVISAEVDLSQTSFARILVAVDDSKTSEAAAQFAIEYAIADRAKLIVCGVADTGLLLRAESTFAYDPTRLVHELTDAARSVVERHSTRARERGLAVERIVTTGDPGQRIVATAREHGVGTIVVGTHGRRGVSLAVLGSVAEGVVRHSPVPVVVVRTAERRNGFAERSDVAESRT